ncbi:MAG: branched-chain amino acid ABC transporter permease [Phycisphaerae bacterium]|nr:branched-chain amino acid ABC transporter permease [Phycisphaerae bacterium]
MTRVAPQLDDGPAAWRFVPRNLAPLGAALGLALLMHFVFQPAAGSFASKLALDIAVNIILAVSLTMVNGFTGQFSMGTAGFMAVGGYAAAAVTYYGSFRLYGSPNPPAGILSAFGDPTGLPLPWLQSGDLMFVAACLFGGLVAAGAGYIVGLPSLRLRGDYLAIVTLGFGEIVRVVLQTSERRLSNAEQIAGTPWPKLLTHLGGSLGFTSIPYFTTLFWVWLAAVLTLVVAYRMKRSSYGRAFLSIREDEVAAEAMGVCTTKFKVRAFVISSFFAGVAGALIAHQVQSINAGELGFQRSFDVIIMVVLGGMGSISGAVLAAGVLTVLPELLRFMADYRMVVYALALIVMMIVRPQGLFGVREVWEVGPFRRRAAGSGAPGGGAT